MSRNYNTELKDVGDHRYAYNFDTDVMHQYMIRSFAPFFTKTNVLELGSCEGEFTKRLLPYSKYDIDRSHHYTKQNRPCKKFRKPIGDVSKVWNKWV